MANVVQLFLARRFQYIVQRGWEVIHGHLIPPVMNTVWNGIDLSFVAKQTALVGMDGRILAKHSLVLKYVLTKFNILCNISIK